MFHFLLFTSLFRSLKRNYAHQHLFLPAWLGRSSTPDEAKAIVTVWNPKRDQLTCPNITGQLAVLSLALICLPWWRDQQRSLKQELTFRPPRDWARKQAVLYWGNCLFTRRAALRQWSSFPLADFLHRWLGLPCGGHLRGHSTFLYTIRLPVELWLTYGLRSQAFHSIFVISTARHCSFRAALGWHCGNQILGQHTGVEGSGCVSDQEAKTSALQEAVGHLGCRKVGEKKIKGSYISQMTNHKKKKKHFYLPSKLKRYQ